MFSIRRFLIFSLTAVLFAAGVLVTSLVYWIAGHQVEELFDGQLVQRGRLLASWLEQSDAEAALTVRVLPAPGHSYERYVAVQHVSAQGELLFSTSVALDEVLGPLVPGVSVQTVGQRHWHVFSQPLSDGKWLMVAEEQHVRDELSNEAMLAIVTPFLLVWPFLIIALLWALRRGLRPLTELEQALRERNERHLKALEYGSDVAELHLFVRELNRLLARIDEVLAREKRFTDDSAHELRTLLSILQLHAENAKRAESTAERGHALGQLQAGIDRAARTVKQLLFLARLDADIAVESRPVAVMPVLRQVLADMLSHADAAGQELALEPEGVEKIEVRLDPELLATLLRNLIDNAIRYSPSGSLVAVKAKVDGGMLDLRVEDGGPGMPAQMAGREGERFLRGDHGVSGTGLGLSIVRRIVESCAGQVSFQPRQEGLAAAVVIRLPVVIEASGVV
ncbi:MAG: ATP-binding protein [Alcanivoracaceae bacterium]|nr:ATP-binding protein [Alcanivoracaceae bacterium]